MSERRSDRNGLSCTTTTCQEDAVIYCLVCKQLFCQSHHEVHDGLMKLLLTPHEVMSSEDYFAETEEKRYCTQHTRLPIVLACEKCYHPMCLKCIDHVETEATHCPDQEKHQTRQIEHVAAKVQEEVRDLLSELRARELVNADDLKKRQKIFDEQTEENRLDLDKLATKICELHKMLDELADQTRETLVKHMNEKKDLMQKWEKDFADYQQECIQAHNETSRIMEMNNEFIVKEQAKIKQSLSPLIRFKIKDKPPAMKQMSLLLKDDTVNLHESISLRETCLFPTSIVYKEARNTPSGKSVYAVQYVNDGQLLVSGDGCQVNGLNYTSQNPSCNSIYSIFEHKTSLYILHYSGGHYYIDVLNLPNQTAQQSVINYSGGGGDYHQITVNDDYIIVTEYRSKTAKVYSTKTHCHQFDIRHECINGYPWGVAFLKDTIVVGDWKKNQVSNITVSASPELRWTCGGIECPTAIRVGEDSQMILVASYTQKQIYIVSYEGEKLTTLDVSQSGVNIYDMAVYENKLAIADNSVKIYEIKANTD